MRTTTLYLAMFYALFALLFTACSKDNNTNPDIDDTEEPKDQGTAEQLQKDIVGKWMIEENDLDIMASAAQSKDLKTAISNRIPSTKIASINTMSAGTTSAFIEFLADGTFIILDSNGSVSIGDYTAKDGQTIDLSGFGSIKDIKFTSGNIDCVIHYERSGSAKTLTIKGKKTVQIPASERTTFLSRKWQAERLQYKGWNGDLWEDLVWENGSWSGEGEMFGNVEFEKFVVQFSPSGTYFAQIYDKQGKLIESTVEYWKWHPSNQNKFIAWTADENEPTSNFDDFTVDILQLSQTKLVVESHGDDDGSQHMTFKAVN